VLNAGLKPSRYAQHLLEVARGLGRLNYAAAVTMAGVSSLEGRVRLILEATRSRAALTRRAVIATLAVFGCVVAVLAMLSPTATLEAAEPARATIEDILEDWQGEGELNVRVSTPTLGQRRAANMGDGAKGVVVSQVRPGPAKEAGLEVGDFITRVDLTEIESKSHFYAVIRRTRPGSLVELTYVNDGREQVTYAEVRGPKTKLPALVVGEVISPTGTPVADAMVYRYVSVDVGGSAHLTPRLSNSQGRFIFSNPLRQRVVGRCHLVAVARGDHVGCADVGLPMKNPAVIRLEKGVTTTGRLIADQRRPLTDILVKLGDISGWAPGKRYSMMYVETRTDGAGRFDLPPLPAGCKVELDLEVPGYAKPPRGLYSLEQIEKGILFGKGGVPRGASVEGVVTASDTGEPVGPVTLRFYNRSSDFQRRVSIGRDGCFRVTNIPPGPLTCDMAEEDEEVAKLGYAVARAKLDLTEGQSIASYKIEALPCAVVTGRVTDEKKQGVGKVQVWHSDVARRVFRDHRTETAADGSYRIVLPPGRVRLRAERRGWESVSGDDDLNLTAGQQTTHDFVLRRKSWATGAEVAEPPPGQATVTIEGAVVAADTDQPIGPLTLTCSSRSNRRFRRQIRVSPAGHFRAVGLPSGPVTLEMRDDFAMSKLGYFVPKTTLDVRAKQPAASHELKAVRCAVVTGKVETPDGEPADGCIVAWRLAGGFQSPRRPGVARDGRYRLVVAPTDVCILALGREWEMVGKKHTRLRLDPGQNATADLVVRRRRVRTVTGTVVDAQGQPVGGALIRKHGSPFGTRPLKERDRRASFIADTPPNATCDRDGRFELKGIAEKDCRWIVQHPTRGLRDVLVVDSQTAVPVRIVLRTRTGSVRGRLVDTERKPLQGWVTMHAWRGRHRFEDGPFRTGADGRFFYEQVLGDSLMRMRPGAGEGAGLPPLEFYVEAGQDLDFGDIVMRRLTGKPAPKITATPIDKTDAQLSWEGLLKNKVVRVASPSDFLPQARDQWTTFTQGFDGTDFRILLLCPPHTTVEAARSYAPILSQCGIIAIDEPDPRDPTLGRTARALHTFGLRTGRRFMCDRQGIVRKIGGSVDVDEIKRLLEEDVTGLPRPTAAERVYESTVPDSVSKMLKNHLGVSLRFEPQTASVGDAVQLRLTFDPSPGLQIKAPAVEASLTFERGLRAEGRAEEASIEWRIDGPVLAKRTFTLPVRVGDDLPENGAGVCATVSLSYGRSDRSAVSHTRRELWASLSCRKE